MKKGIKVALFIAFIGICSMLAFGRDVSAYIDPSLTTYVIQAIAGIVVVLGTAVGIYIRRAKKKVSDKLGIDENRNKEVETDEIVVDDKE